MMLITLENYCLFFIGEVLSESSNFEFGICFLVWLMICIVNILLRKKQNKTKQKTNKNKTKQNKNKKTKTKTKKNPKKPQSYLPY